MKLPYRFGRYTLVEKIAEGGTAEVYRAILSGDEGFRKTVAVKRILPAWGGSGELESMLVDEARALMHLAHQAIIQVFELGRCEGMPFIAMEFVDGIDCARLLTRSIRDGTPLPLIHALYIITQVLTALEFAHRSVDVEGRPLCIVHRDVSPSNILFSWNGEVKVTDFGIAKGLHRTQKTQVGQLKGKYAYMSPEQARGHEIDARSDIFSCGIILYELLTARRLFDARTDLELLERVKEANLGTEAISMLPPELRAVLYLALARDREGRYQSAAEMLSDIRGFARSSGTMGSSLEFAAFLRERFPLESGVRKRDVPPRALIVQQTKVLKESIRFAKGRLGVWGRSVGVVCILAAWALMPSPIAGRTDLATKSAAATKSEKVVATGDVSEPPIAHGKIAIDSRPTGAEGKITLGGKSQRIRTPFAVDSVEIGDGIDGRIEISAPGFDAARQTFKLTVAKPAFVGNIELKRQILASISINAMPWGLVDIPGLVSGRETPIRDLKTKAGAYSVSVRHPPSGQVAMANITLSEGDLKRCLATFGQKAVLSCK